MGMFDEIYKEVAVKCPCGEKIHDFQTKDLCNCLFQFRITKNNGFEFKKNEYIPTTPAERGKFGFPLVKVISSEWISYPVSVALNFYTFCDKCNKYSFDGTCIIDEGNVKHLKI